MSMPPGGTFVPEPEGTNALAASLDPVNAAAIAAEMEAMPKSQPAQQDSQFGYATATPAPPPPPPQFGPPPQAQAGYGAAPESPTPQVQEGYAPAGPASGVPQQYAQHPNPLQQNPQQPEHGRNTGVTATQQLSGVMFHTEDDNSPGRNSLTFALIGWLLGGLAFLSFDGLGFVSLVLFVLGVVFGIQGVNKSRAGRATNGVMAGWGLGLSITGLVAIIAQIVLTAIFYASVLDEAAGWIGGDGGYDLGTVPTTIEVGDCFADPYLAQSEGLEGWDAFKEVPCTQPHYGEVYFRGELSLDSVGPATSIFEVSGQACGDEFTPATGEDYVESEWYIDHFYPTQAEWDVGLREYTCALI